MPYAGKKYIKLLLTLSVCFFFSLIHFYVANAEETSGNRTIKAGIFSFDGYHMKDEEGNLTGYGIEFLNLVSEYSHLNFEYIGYDKSWNDMQSMLENGEIDIVTSARLTPEREEKFAFSMPIGRNNTVLSIQAENTKLHTGDYYAYDGMIIGLIVGSSQNQNLVEFAEEKHFSYATREYDDADKLTQALQRGEIDAILSSNLRKTENEKILDTIASDNFYAIVRKEDTDILNEVNYAIEQMGINEGDWSNELYYQYYGPVYSLDLHFTEREKAYIQDVISGKKTITAMVMPDQRPYSYVEDGEAKGILTDYFTEVMEFAGLPYEMVVPKSREEYYALADTNGVDIVVDLRSAAVTSLDSPYRGFYTDEYISTGLAKVTRKDLSHAISKVAVVEFQGRRPLEQGILRDEEILLCSTREEALYAVLKRKADATFVQTYTAQTFVNNDSTASLQYTMENNSFSYRMYIRGSCDHELVTILNKCIHRIPNDLLTQLITQYTAPTPADVTFIQYMQSNPQVMISITLIFILGCCTILGLYLRSRWNKKILVAMEKSKQKLEEQFAIVDVLSREYLNVYALDKDRNRLKAIKVRGYKVPNLFPDEKDEFSYSAFLDGYVQHRVYSEDKTYLQEALSLEMVEEKLSEAAEYVGSYRVVIDQEIRTYQFTYIRVEGEAAKNGSFILVGFRSIDDMVRKEQEQKEILSTALAEAQYASTAKTTFLNNMSHDIRTPMNAIIGFTTLALSHIQNRDLVTNYLGKIMTSSKHLLSLINDVLDMSRIESGKVKIEEKEASLPEILHDLKIIVQSEVKAKQLNFFIDTLDVTNENIICDKLRLNQVLLNVLSNAMKYTKPGGTVSVRIAQIQDDSEDSEGYASYEFRVKDTGIGMSKQFVKHVFEPFEREQTATVSGIQGTGLGLAITKNIVDMMNGTISVTSEEGVGSEFTISFRFKVAGSPVQVEYLDKLQDVHALIVDDDIHACMSVSKMLSSIGMRPDWTTLGKEAVVRTEFALEQNEPFGVYIIDWLMPDMNGVELVRRIRKVIDSAAPVILLTAYDWADIEEEAKEAGVTDFCSKPIFLSELCKILTASYRTAEEEKEDMNDVKEFASKRLLLVEDNELNQEIAKTILEEAGFTIDTADDGTVAVEVMEKMPGDTYDLILMDIQMPLMDGYKTTRAIRAMDDPVKASIPIIAMTANAFDEDRQKAVDAGMDGYIAKPINIENLMGTLREFLL